MGYDNDIVFAVLLGAFRAGGVPRVLLLDVESFVFGGGLEFFMPLSRVFVGAFIDLAEEITAEGYIFGIRNFLVHGQKHIHIPLGGMLRQAQPIGYGTLGSAHLLVQSFHDLAKIQRDVEQRENFIFDKFLVLPLHCLLVPGSGIKFRTTDFLVHNFSPDYP